MMLEFCPPGSQAGDGWHVLNAGLARHICHMVKVNFGIRIIKIDCWRQNALVYGHGAGYQLGKALPRPSSGLSRPWWN